MAAEDSRRRARWARAALAVLAAVSISTCSRPRERPNVVLISIDCMNERQIEQALADGTAPHLAALSRESLVFTRAHAHAPWTTPSHMSMLSGLYPSQHGRDIPVSLAGMIGSIGERKPTYETIADRLSAVGYEAVAFVGKGSISAKWGLGQGFSLYVESDQKNDGHSDLVRSQPAIEQWLSRRKPGPFFLFLHTYDLHYPLPASRSSSAEAIRFVDAHIGGFLSALRQGGQYDSTLVIVTGDHGSEMTHVEGKCCLHGAGHYEENLRVPLLVKLPKPGSTGRSDALVRHVDILPTVLEVAGLPNGSYQGPGVSLLAGSGDSGDGLVSFSEADARCVSRRAVTTRRYKYIYTPQDPWLQSMRRVDLLQDDLCKARPECQSPPLEELYDLERDPFEEHNLLSGEVPPDAARALDRLRGELDRHLNLPPAYRFEAMAGGRPQRAATAQIDDGVEEALRALGYLK